MACFEKYTLKVIGIVHKNCFLSFLDSRNVSGAGELENLSQFDSSLPNRPHRGFSETVGHDYDLLDDIDSHKDIYRLKVI